MNIEDTLMLNADTEFPLSSAFDVLIFRLPKIVRSEISSWILLVPLKGVSKPDVVVSGRYTIPLSSPCTPPLLGNAHSFMCPFPELLTDFH